MISLDEIKKISHDHPVMFFDGECIFCIKALQFFMKIDKQEALRYTTLQSDEGKMVREFLGLSTDIDSVVLIDKGEFYTKSDVTFQTFKHLGQPYRALSIIRILPRFFRDFFYDLTARNRYKIFGKRDTCIIPNASQKHLFLNS